MFFVLSYGHSEIFFSALPLMDFRLKFFIVLLEDSYPLKGILATFLNGDSLGLKNFNN